MRDSITSWLENLARNPQRPDALETYRLGLKRQRNYAIPGWFAGMFGILVGYQGLCLLRLGPSLEGQASAVLHPGPNLTFFALISMCLWTGLCVLYYQRAGGLGNQPTETRSAYNTLLQYSSYRQMCRKLGEESVLVLNEGARRLLQCRELLANPVWTSKALAPSRKRAAEDAAAAAEAAMFRVVRLVVAQGDLQEAHLVVTQLQDLAESLGRLTLRQEDLAAHAGDGQASIRAALITLRELEVAEAEVQRETFG
jgi:hypothetical protein